MRMALRKTTSITSLHGWFVCVTLLAGAAPAHGAVVEPELGIVIRTYDAAVTTGDLPRAMEAARMLLADAGIGVTWVRCDVAFVERGRDACLAPLAANELAIRFVLLPPHIAAKSLVTLGDSLIDTQRRTGSLATIYLNRVTQLASRCGIEVATLLGRALAHEVGHLLLGTSDHAATGLMRPSWSQAALRRGDASDWRFTARDTEALRNSVRARNAQQMAAGRIGE
jgi:hypothetical protein